MLYHDNARLKRFQSTLPVWGATYARLYTVRPLSSFNPRSPCGERPTASTTAVANLTVSIHAPRVGSDGIEISLMSPCGVSIHAPRVGSDPRY